MKTKRDLCTECTMLNEEGCKFGGAHGAKRAGFDCPYINIKKDSVKREDTGTRFIRMIAEIVKTFKRKKK